MKKDPTNRVCGDCVRAIFVCLGLRAEEGKRFLKNNQFIRIYHCDRFGHPVAEDTIACVHFEEDLNE